MLRLGLLFDSQVGVGKCFHPTLGEEILVLVVRAQDVGVPEEGLALHTDLQVQSDNRSVKHPG